MFTSHGFFCFDHIAWYIEYKAPLIFFLLILVWHFLRRQLLLVFFTTIYTYIMNLKFIVQTKYYFRLNMLVNVHHQKIHKNVIFDILNPSESNIKILNLMKNSAYLLLCWTGLGAIKSVCKIIYFTIRNLRSKIHADNCCANHKTWFSLKCLWDILNIFWYVLQIAQHDVEKVGVC